ncbi:MAG: DEAD/DEAH box helicase [Erysipelotrichaceae bacterium]
METTKTEMLGNTLILNNGETTILNELIKSLEGCKQFQFNVAFVNFSGIQLFLKTFDELKVKGVQGKIITSTYLNFSDPKALNVINEFNNIELKVYSDTKTKGFHSKAYIFEYEENYKVIIGSANITVNALKNNIEWNVQTLSKKEDKFIIEVLKEYNDIWNSLPELTQDFLTSYERFINELKEHNLKNMKQFNYDSSIKPNTMQIEAMRSLNNLREHKETRALVIAATGTGKTYMSCFDIQQYKPKKVLFLVHREDILRKSIESYKRVLGDNLDCGLYTGNKKDSEAKYLFANINTMVNHYQMFDKDEFDYIVVDEAHHATSPIYDKVLSYFEPEFMLGMTATPERTDGGDIFALFNNNVALEIRLQEAMADELVVPFHYFGITDIEDIDYKNIDLNDIATLANILKVNKRVDYVIEKMKFYGHDGDKTKCLGFCANIDHANYMREEFNKRGITSAVLTGDDSTDNRTLIISKLEDDSDSLKVIFCVNILNEGIDIPSINLVLMLRPTASPIVFIQQLGRGLRKNLDKEFLTVLDFIGNHNRAYLIAIALKGSRFYDKDSLKVAVVKDFDNIPGKTFIQMDKISKKLILDQLERENFNRLRYLKEEYNEFKKMNSGLIPYYLMDYIKYEGAPNPLKFINKSFSYIEFLNIVEKNDKLISSLNNELFLRCMRYLSRMLPIKRPYEFAIIKAIISNKSLSMEDIKYYVSKYIIDPEDSTIEHAIAVLNFERYDLALIKRYDKLIEYKDNNIIGSTIFNELLENSNYKNYIIDILNYGLYSYNKEFGLDNYGVPFLKLYSTYTMMDVGMLSNIENKLSSFRGQGLLTYKNEYYLFVNLHKDASIDEAINYKDKFIDRCNFQWESPNNTSQFKGNGPFIVKNVEKNINLHLFVRKFKKIDDETLPYIYLGKVNTTKAYDNKPIRIEAQFENEVPVEIYEELINKVEIKNN